MGRYNCQSTSIYKLVRNYNILTGCHHEDSVLNTTTTETHHCIRKEGKVIQLECDNKMHKIYQLARLGSGLANQRCTVERTNFSCPT